jgi:hypothetical protein
VVTCSIRLRLTLSRAISAQHGRRQRGTAYVTTLWPAHALSNEHARLLGVVNLLLLNLLRYAWAAPHGQPVGRRSAGRGHGSVGLL